MQPVVFTQLFSQPGMWLALPSWVRSDYEFIQIEILQLFICNVIWFFTFCDMISSGGLIDSSLWDSGCRLVCFFCHQKMARGTTFSVPRCLTEALLAQKVEISTWTLPEAAVLGSCLVPLRVKQLNSVGGDMMWYFHVTVTTRIVGVCCLCFFFAYL